MMEHRWNTRKNANLRLMCYLNSSDVIPAKVRNMSLSGMFIETGPVFLSRNDRVDIAFSLPNADESAVYRLTALTIHSSREGIGVMFCDMNPDVYAQFVKSYYRFFQPALDVDHHARRATANSR
jgi:hypothetical protein